MANDANKDDVALVIPDETQEKYPDLVRKITNSKSMNNSERNYWLQVLPVMTEEQVKELEDILDTEIRKLKEIDEKYSKMEAAAAARGGKKAPAPELSSEEIKKLDAEKKEKRKIRQDAEKKAQEENNADDILAQLGL